MLALEAKPNRKSNHRLLMLLIGLLFSRMGTSIYTLALPLIAYDLTGSGMILGSVFAVEMLPFIVLLPIGGVMIDRFNRRKLMMAADLCRMLFVAVIPYLYLTGHLNIQMIFILAFLLSSMSFFVDVPLMTIIPSIVPEHELTRSNARIQVVENFSRILGPVVAGLMIGVFGSYLALFINSATYLIMACCIFLIGAIDHQRQKLAPNVWTEMKEGFSYLWNRADIRAIALISFLCNFGMGIFMSTFIFYLKDLLLVSELEIGLVSAFGGILGMIGGMIVSPLVKRYNKTAIISALLILGGGIGAVLIALVPHWIMTAIGFGLWGGSITIMAVILNTYKQKTIPAELFGRVEGSLTSLSYLALPSAGFIGGTLIHSFTSTVTYLIAGASVVVAGLINLKSALRSSPHMKAELLG